MHNSTTPPNNVIVVAVTIVVVTVAVAVTLAIAISSITTAVGGGKRRLDEEKYELKKFVMLVPEERVTIKEREERVDISSCFCSTNLGSSYCNVIDIVQCISIKVCLTYTNSLKLLKVLIIRICLLCHSNEHILK